MLEASNGLLLIAAFFADIFTLLPGPHDVTCYVVLRIYTSTHLRFY